MNAHVDPKDSRFESRNVLSRETFAARLFRSDGFQALYSRITETVERSAAYLDGDARRYAKTLGRVDQARFAAATMKLSTDLIRTASAASLLKAVGEGRATCAEAVSWKRKRVGAKPASAPWEGAPPELLALADEAAELERLMERYVEAAEDAAVGCPDVGEGPAREAFRMLEASFRPF